MTIFSVNDSREYEVREGISLLELSSIVKPQLRFRVVAAKVNNVERGLGFRLYNNAQVEFLDIASPTGMRIYTRSLLFVVAKALDDLHKGADISVEASVSNGFFLQLLNNGEGSVSLDRLKERIDEIIRADIPFERHTILTSEAVRLFEGRAMSCKAKLLSTLGSLYTSYYTLGDYPDYYYGDLCPSTGWIELYGLEESQGGLFLRLPDPQNPGMLKPFVKQEKMLDVFRQYHLWQDMGGVRTVGDFNELCTQGHTSELINVAEAMQERNICRIAEQIKEKGSVRMVLIAGPSSSGKTTFSKRLSVQMMVNGLHPRPISMDEYFVPRAQTPRDENGDYDYETIEALNLPLLQDHLQRLFRGEEIELPHYDFQSGQSMPNGQKMRLQQNDVLIMEGIHALNPRLTPEIADELKYKVYVSALTTIQLDNHNYISTRDNRLLRRIVRDYKYRGCSARDTIQRWPSVSKGENKWIFPFQEEADAIFNSALLFELAGLRTQALPLLEMVEERAPEYAEAQRLCKFLGHISPITIEALPPTSLLREFMGGSSFRY